MCRLSAKRNALADRARLRYAAAMLVLALNATAALAAPQCHSVPIERMIADYAMMQQRQETAHIAPLFGPAGMIDNAGSAPIKGETAVAAFLAGFKGYVVTSNELRVEKVIRVAQGWQATGRFHQTGHTPDKTGYDVNGSFDSTWSCSAAGWRILRMATGK